MMGGRNQVNQTGTELPPLNWVTSYRHSISCYVFCCRYPKRIIDQSVLFDLVGLVCVRIISYVTLIFVKDNLGQTTYITIVQNLHQLKLAYARISLPLYLWSS